MTGTVPANIYLLFFQFLIDLLKSKLIKKQILS